MKRFILVMALITLLPLNFALAGDPYGVFIIESPDMDYDHLQVRGITSKGEFTATMIENLAGTINRTNMKGVFGKVDPKKNKAVFEWMQVYDPPNNPPAPADPTWTMGFMGMSDSGLTTSFLFEKYPVFGEAPPNSQILRWTHLWNSLGYEEYTDIHQNNVMLAITEGHADWKDGLITDINASARCVGWFNGGDSYSFNTNNGKFDFKFFHDVAPFGSTVQLWNIADNNYAVGVGYRFGGTEREIFIMQVTSTPGVRFLKDEDSEVVPSPHVMSTAYNNDPFTGDVAISNLNEIAFIGELTGSTPGIVNYNFNTGAKRMMIEWADDVLWGDYQDIRLCDMTSENAPLLVGYMTRIADGKIVGYIAYPL